MPKVIDSLYWVVHPAYLVPWKKSISIQSFSSAKKYVKEVLTPLVKRVQGDPSAVVIFVPSPANELREDIINSIHTDPARIKKMIEIEDEFSSFAKKMLKNRFIIADHPSTQLVARIASNELFARGFKVSAKVKVFSCGALWEKCVKAFPQEFLEEYTKKGKAAQGRASKKIKELIAKEGLGKEPRKQAVRLLVTNTTREMWPFFRAPESMSLSERFFSKKPVGWKARRTTQKRRG